MDSDQIMSQLEELNILAQKQNDLLRSMIDDIQKDWSEEEKMQINNPEEYKRLQLQKTEETPMAKELSKESIEILKKCLVEDKIIRLPTGNLDRKIYLEVKTKLELIGGKWKGNKTQGFVFLEDPSDLLKQISEGENRNIKKEFQFFATHPDLADRLCELAEIDENNRVLEPSAGQGAIVNAINKLFPDMGIECCEMMPLNRTILSKNPSVILKEEDFLKTPDSYYLDQFDKIIANPPFSKNQDIDHIKRMWQCLKKGGRIVTISSNHWRNSDNKKEKEFKQWLDSVGHDLYEVDAGSFKDSGTMISSNILVINK